MPTLTAAGVSKPHLPGAPPPEPEHLPCPRCESTNTKFCYYNNYNFSQPRHFCKGCRRYWTHGGTLRDIPVGGGSRKNAKRSRLSNPSTYASNNNIISTNVGHMAVPTTTLLGPFGGEHLRMCESFTSLLSGSGGHGHHGGFFGFEDGFGRGVWPFHGVGIGGEGGGYVVGGGGGYGGGSTWQVESGHEGGGGGSGGDQCFALPELAISTPGMM